jgi:hypothetical protein
VLAAPASAAPTAAGLAERLAEPWLALQQPDGSFPDSIRPGTHDWGRYGDAGLGYGLMLAGLRTHRPDWVEAGARAQAHAAGRATDRSSAFETMLIASGYNLLRLRAPATPTFVAQRALWQNYLIAVKPLFNARGDAPRLSSNKYLVEAVAFLELAHSGLRSTLPGAVLSVPGDARRRALYTLNRLVPRRIDSLIGHAAGRRLTSLSDPGSQPLAYHSLSAGMLARAIELAGPAASRPARRALGIAARTIWAYQAPDGDLAYFGRSQDQSWALALAALAAARAAPSTCGADGHNLAAVADRSLRRLGARYPVRPDGMAIVPSANGPATVPALDNYASQVVYNGLTLTALEWAARAAHRLRGCSPGRLLSDRRSAAVLPFELAQFATVRRGRVWMAVKRRSQGGDGRYAFGIRALKLRRPGRGWVDLLPTAPAVGGAFGPLLALRSGALALPRGQEIEVRRGAIVVRGGWMHGGRWARRKVAFRFVPTRRGARVVVATHRGDTLVYSALSDGRPSGRPDGVDAQLARTRSSRPASVAVSGPYASSGSLDVWRSDLTVRATGKRVAFTVRGG